MVTITHVAERSSNDDASPQHELVRELLLGAALLPRRNGLGEVLDLVTDALNHDSLDPETAFHLGQQLRLVTGDEPIDGDLDGHLLLQALLSELIEVTSLVDGVHVDDLDPLLEHLLFVGDLAEARRITHLAEAARARVRVLDRSLAADLGAA